MLFFLQVILPIITIAISLVFAWRGGRWTFSWLDRVIRDPGGIFLAWLLNAIAWLLIGLTIAFFMWYGGLLVVTYPYGSIQL